MVFDIAYRNDILNKQKYLFMSQSRYITRPTKGVCTSFAQTHKPAYTSHASHKKQLILDNALELGGVGEVLGNQAQRGNFLGLGGLRPGQVHFAARLVHLPGGVKSGNKVHRLLQKSFVF